MSTTTDPVLTRIVGAGGHKVAFATLHAEPSLNSLTLEMIEVLQTKLDAWKQDPAIAAVVLQGAGEKAFCAGGDIRRLYQSITSNKREGVELFFEKEYTLDYAIHKYPKPLLVWGHGIVMGGGLGLFAGASHRIVTETTKIAMPEITIGLYPDVGAGYFLNRMPPGVGLFLGLTGTRMNAADALFTQLGNVFIQRSFKETLFQELEGASWTANESNNFALANRILHSFETRSVDSLGPSAIESHMTFIRQAARTENIQAFASCLKAQYVEDPWLASAAKSFFAGSPTSARIIFEQLRRTRGLPLEECFAMDMTLSTQCARHSDLAEGIRALLIDKDNKPKWSPATLDQVSDALVEEHFTWPHSQPNPLAKWGRN